MRISSARIKGFGPFRDVSIDFDSLPESSKLVALCGDNGVGKSTLVDLLVDGASWREWPRRPGTKIDHVANDRDSLLEVTHEIGGKRYFVRHLVDGVSSKGESAVYCNGEALTKSGKLTEFYAFAKENFPAKSVVHSSIVSHPAYGSFVTMKATERKDVILLALGVEGIEKLAAAARKEIDKASSEVAGIRRELNDALLGSDIQAAEQELSIREKVLHDAGWLVAEAQTELDVARQLAGDSALARQRYEEQSRAFDDLESRAKQAANARDYAEGELVKIDIVALENAVTKATTDRDLAAKRLREAESLASELRTAREAANRQLEDRHRVQLELDRATATKVDVEKRLANIRAIIDKGDEIQAAVTKTKELTEIVARLEVDAATAIAEVKRLSAEVAAHDADRIRHNESAAEAERRIARANKTLDGAELVRVAAARLEGEREAVSACKAHVESTERELESMRKKLLSAKDVRLDCQREVLSDIATSTTSDADELREMANDSISEDIQCVNESDELPELIESAENELELYRSGLRSAEEQLRNTEALAAKLPLIEAAELELAEARGALNTALSATEESERKATETALENSKQLGIKVGREKLIRDTRSQIATFSELVAIADKLIAATGLRDERIAQLATATADVGRLTEELESLPEPEPVADDPDVFGLRKAHERASDAVLLAERALAAAVATRAQLFSQVEKLRTEAAALAAQLDTTPAPVPPETAPDLVALESELKLRQEEQTRAAQGVGVAQARLDAAQASASKARALSVELSTSEVELADWTRLAADLGRKGLQAALVDSAGPELTRATNDLLHSCFGTRWTVTYETQRPKENGGVSEGYDVRIIDTERGRDSVVEDLSDGERTIIGEAASLALTELACKRSGFDNPTLIRDESGAALSPEKRPMWVAMLRRAAQHVNADRVIVISHSEDVQELCDVRMRVADGKVTVES